MNTKDEIIHPSPFILYPSLAMTESLARRALGVSSQNLNATEALWDFFRSHPRR